MSKIEIERKVRLSRAEAGRLLTNIGKALTSGEDAEFTVGHDEIKLWVADHLDVEIEIEIDGDETELEIELTWKSGSAVSDKAAADQASSDAAAEATPAAPAAKTRTTRRRAAAR